MIIIKSSDEIQKIRESGKIVSEALSLAGEIIKPNKLDIIKNAINILENNFSNNCCQANCLTHKTSSKCQVQCYSSYTNCTTVWSYIHTTIYC